MSGEGTAKQSSVVEFSAGSSTTQQFAAERTKESEGRNFHNASTTILLNAHSTSTNHQHTSRTPLNHHANMQTAADVTVLVSSDNSFSERRINPSWTISALKAKLYPITGIPVGSQQLTLRLPQAPAPINIVAVDEDATQLSQFLLQHSIGAEIHVCTFLSTLLPQRLVSPRSYAGQDTFPGFYTFRIPDCST